MHHKLYLWSFVLLASLTFLYVQGQFYGRGVSERLAFLVPNGMTAAVSGAFEDSVVTYLTPEEYAQEGFFMHDIRTGAGAVTAEDGKKLTIHFTIETPQGELVRSTKGSEPYVFILGRGEVIEGFEIGLQGMRAGGTRTLVIPPAYAYGNKRFEGLPAGVSLVFTVDLIKMD